MAHRRDFDDFAKFFWVLAGVTNIQLAMGSPNDHLIELNSSASLFNACSSEDVENARSGMRIASITSRWLIPAWIVQAFGWRKSARRKAARKDGAFR